MRDSNETKSPAQRRRFLKSAVTASVGAGAMAAPAFAQAPAVTSLRFQSTWPSKDIFHEYALDFAKKVNDMTGGELKIEVLPAGSVVPAFGLFEAVSKGTLDGGHGILGYHYGKQNALALWNSGPMFGMDANMLLAWHKYGGGAATTAKALRLHRWQCSVLPLRPDDDAAAGLVQEADHQARGFQGPEVPHQWPRD